jgi:hypothetical protein
MDNQSDSGAVMELPRYRCHKEVWALKIEDINSTPDDGSFSGGAIIFPAEKRYSSFPVSAEYVAKHKPRIGGYYVRYKDGYESFSPAEAFEDGYTLIG